MFFGLFFTKKKKLQSYEKKTIFASKKSFFFLKIRELQNQWLKAND